MAGYLSFECAWSNSSLWTENLCLAQSESEAREYKGDLTTDLKATELSMQWVSVPTIWEQQQ